MITAEFYNRLHSSLFVRSLVMIMIAFAIIYTSGCASSGTNRTLAEGAVIGTLGGAAIGALTGRPENIMIGAAGGLAAGAAAGYAVGRTQNTYVQKKEAINRAIKDVNSCNNLLESRNRQLRSEITALSEAIDNARVQSDARSRTKRELAARKQRLQAEVRKDAAGISSIRDKMSNYERDYGSLKAKGFQNAEFENEMSRLRLRFNEYNALLKDLERL
jgi:hypothetical protein